MADDIRPISPLPPSGQQVPGNKPRRRKRRGRRQESDKSVPQPDVENASREQPDEDDPRGQKIDVKI